MKQKKESPILKILFAFLEKNLTPDRPLLLGYSGGPDSKALLYALRDYPSIQLHVAHVDHGWRQESAQEAKALQDEVQALGFPFHTVRLELPSLGNAEEKARQERLRFFHSLFVQIPFQALLLAHQADDLAETVLKRTLEGAHLCFLKGMEAVSCQQGMPIWRPLLAVRKKEVLTFLQERALLPLWDRTNEDPAYLRARIRTQMLPALQQQFGKQCVENLLCLSERATELKAFLDLRVSARFQEIQRGPWGEWVSLEGLERIERRHFLQILAKQKGVVLTRILLESLLDRIEQGTADCRFCIDSFILYVDRTRLFLLAPTFPRFQESVRLQIGRQRCGDWEIELREELHEAAAPDWTSVWKGNFTIGLQKGNYLLKWDKPEHALKKLWCERRVPACLRGQLPFLIQEGGGRRYDLLSGQSRKPEKADLKLTFSCVSSGTILTD